MDHDATPSSRLFVGIAPPKPVVANLEEAARRYRSSIERAIPTLNLHLTLVFLGNITARADQLNTFSQVLTPSFLPTVSITHIGRGLQPKQLWAYAQATPALQELRAIVLEHLAASNFLSDTPPSDSFVPHITLAHLREGAEILDSAVITTFPVREIALWQSISTPGGTSYQLLAQAAIER